MAVNVSIPKGTRDFLPVQMAKRNYIFSVLKEFFQLYGFLPIETPSMENLSTLMGKYGEEGDKLLFKILNSGNFLSEVQIQNNENDNLNQIASKICEKGLRYDLTVPFARFVVMHRNEITFPFKRYQMQPVWRADRPQKGRYREFYQCDVDSIGSNSLLNEWELIRIIDDVFKKLQLKVVIKINNRKLLSGLAQSMGFPEKLTEMTVALDKIDKIGKQAVVTELLNEGFTQSAIDNLFHVIDKVSENPIETLQMLEVLEMPEDFKQGLSEMNQLLHYSSIGTLNCTIDFNLSLARGLSYYTGTIFEVVATETEMGSICGGGRYDDLTGIFGVKGLSGVGISFGAERIYDVLETLQRFPATAVNSTQVLIANFGDISISKCLELSCALRESGFSVEVYPDADAKMKKQFAYADSLKIPWVLIIGETEMETNSVSVKNMITGNQEIINQNELKDFLFKHATNF